jgi:hypothetical protein
MRHFGDGASGLAALGLLLADSTRQGILAVAFISNSEVGKE